MGDPNLCHMFSFLATKISNLSCRTGYSRRGRLAKDVSNDLNLVFIKMKDSSVYSFREQEDAKTVSALKTVEKEKTILSRRV